MRPELFLVGVHRDHEILLRPADDRGNPVVIAVELVTGRAFGGEVFAVFGVTDDGENLIRQVDLTRGGGRRGFGDVTRLVGILAQEGEQIGALVRVLHPRKVHARVRGEGLGVFDVGVQRVEIPHEPVVAHAGQTIGIAKAIDRRRRAPEYAVQLRAGSVERLGPDHVAGPAFAIDFRPVLGIAEFVGLRARRDEDRGRRAEKRQSFHHDLSLLCDT